MPLFIQLKRDLEISAAVVWESLDSPKEVMLFMLLQALFIGAGGIVSAMIQ